MRDESALVVVLLSAFDDDQSLADRELFSPESDAYEGQFSTRPERYPGALHPVTRYVDGLAAHRRDPARLVVASIVGAPAIDDPGTDAEALLAREEMQIPSTARAWRSRGPTGRALERTGCP